MTFTLVCLLTVGYSLLFKSLSLVTRDRNFAARLDSVLKPSPAELLGLLAARCELQAANPTLIPCERRIFRDQATRYRQAQWVALEKSCLTSTK